MDDDLIKILRKKYKEKLPEKIDKIKSHWEDLFKEWDNEKAQSFHKLIHNLSGSSGSYGYPEIGEATKELELYLKELLHNHKPISAQQIKEIETKLKNIEMVINKIILSKQD